MESTLLIKKTIMDTSQFDLKPPGEFTEKLFLQQNQQLAILNAVIQTVSSSNNLHETLEAALEMVLAVVEAPTGWICLLGEDNSCSAFVGHRGLCFPNEAGDPTPCLAMCVCNRVRRTGDVVTIRHLAPGCPLLAIDQDNEELKITGHISVPLMTKSRIVGQLNISFTAPDQADQIDVDLLKTISPQLAVAIENARLWEAVQEKEKLQKELLKKLVTAQEEERRRISRELHDELGQEMTSLLVRLQVLENMDSEAQAGELIYGLKTSVSQLLASIHDMTLELRPTTLDDLGLVPALAQYAKACPANLGIEVDFAEIGISGKRLPREIETTLYRAVQESLTNVARHAQVKKASILLRKNDKTITAIIEDNGIGFDKDDVNGGQSKRQRLGLYGMKERVALVNGTLTVETKPGSGTTIYIEIPVKNM
jgi:signal transduction histidine kinase